MRVLAFDQSLTSSAYVVFDAQDDGKLKLYASGVVKPKGTETYRIQSLYDQFRALMEKYSPSLLARELHYQIQYGNAKALLAVGALIDLIACQFGLPACGRYATIPAPTWKKYLVGKGNIKKDTSYMIKLNEAFAKCSLLSPIGSVVMDDNLGDAIGIGVTAYAAKRHQNDVVAGLLVEKCASVTFAKALDAIFFHGKPV